MNQLFPWSNDPDEQRKIFDKWDNICYENAKREQKESETKLTEQEKELSKRIYLNRDQPTYEEWKAAKEKADQEATQEHRQIVKPRKKTKE